MRKIIIIILFIVLNFLLTSCWDRHEIEENAFVLGIAIDKAQEDGKIRAIFQIARPESFGGEKGGGDQEPVVNMEEVAEDIMIASAELYKDLNLTPNFEHLQVLLIGEEYGKQGIEESLDFLLRNPNIRNRMSVAVVSGEAKKVLEFKTKIGKGSILYINEIMQKNSKESFEVLHNITLSKVYENYARKSPFLIPRVTVEKDKVSLSGSGVFKNNKLIGWLDEKETEGAQWIIGKIGNGALSINLPEDQGERIALRVFTSKSSLKPELREGKLVGKLEVFIEGDVYEVEKPTRMKLSADMINEWEKKLENRAEEIIKSAFNKSRNVFKADVFEIDRRVQNFLPHFWDANRNKWEEAFGKVELDVKVKVKIRRVGSISY